MDNSVFAVKLSLEKARDIRRLHSEGKRNKSELARDYGVSAESIDNIIRGITWKEPGASVPAGSQPKAAVDPVAAALRARAAEVNAPTLAVISKLRSGLDELESCLESDSLAEMLTVITGQAAPPSGSARVLSGLAALLASLGAPQHAPPPAPVLVREKPVQPSQPWKDSVPARSVAEPDADFDEPDYALRRELDDRIEAVNEFMGGWRNLSKEQMIEPLKMHVADMRLAIEQVHDRHPLQRAFAAIVRRLTSIFHESGVEAFVPGLAKSHQEDWLHLREEARKRIRAPKAKLHKVAPAQAEPEPEEPEPPAVSLPLTDARLGGLPVVLATNLRVPARESAFLRATGLHVSSFELNAENPRATAALESRIKKGSCPVVLIAHEFLGHVATGKISDACKSAGVKWAYCGRAGIGALVQALEQIEGALAKAS